MLCRRVSAIPYKKFPINHTVCKQFTCQIENATNTRFWNWLGSGTGQEPVPKTSQNLCTHQDDSIDTPLNSLQCLVEKKSYKTTTI